MQETRHLHWNAEGLWQQLEPLLPGIGVEVVARTDSTNTRLLARARQASGGTEERQSAAAGTRAQDSRDSRDERPSSFGRRSDDLLPCLLVAEHQTQGRGRLGREWHASPGASLTFSLALPLRPVDWSGLSLAVGLALADALDPRPQRQPGQSPLMIKWPNDLWLQDAPGRGRKLGGVLVETINSHGTRLCVVGVGINVQPQPDEGLSQGSACLQEWMPTITAPEALIRVAPALARALLNFQDQGFAAVSEAFAARDLLRGCWVTTTAADLPEGWAEGVDADGALRVRRGKQVQRLISGDVSVRPSAAPPGATGALGQEA